MEERFWAKVNKNGPLMPGMKTRCWVWTGFILNGYGRFNQGPGKTQRAHRIAYELQHGPLPAGMEALHECDLKKCVRHIYAGTQRENMRDAAARGLLSPAKGDANGSRRHPELLWRGEKHTQANVSESEVKEIRARYARGGISQRALGAEYGLSHTAIGFIVRAEHWAHVS